MQKLFKGGIVHTHDFINLCVARGEVGNSEVEVQGNMNLADCCNVTLNQSCSNLNIMGLAFAG
jgi:hypothetical protein